MDKKWWFIYTREYYSVIKRNRLLIYTRHGWIVKALCWYTVYDSSSWNSRKGKTTWRKADLLSRREDGKRKGLTIKGMKCFPGTFYGNVYLDCGDGSLIVSICQNSLNCIIIIWEWFLKKADLKQKWMKDCPLPGVEAFSSEWLEKGLKPIQGLSSFTGSVEMLAFNFWAL